MRQVLATQASAEGRRRGSGGTRRRAAARSARALRWRSPAATRHRRRVPPRATPSATPHRRDCGADGAARTARRGARPGRAAARDDGVRDGADASVRGVRHGARLLPRQSTAGATAVGASAGSPPTCAKAASGSCSRRARRPRPSTTRSECVRCGALDRRPLHGGGQCRVGDRAGRRVRRRRRAPGAAGLDSHRRQRQRRRPLGAPPEPGQVLAGPRGRCRRHGSSPTTRRGRAWWSRAGDGAVEHAHGSETRHRDTGDSTPPTGRAPFLGRDGASSATCWSRPGARRVGGRGRAVEIVGEAGMGKSRLLAELTATIAGGRRPARTSRSCGPTSTGRPCRTRRRRRSSARWPASTWARRWRTPVVRLHAWVHAIAPELLPWLPLVADARRRQRYRPRKPSTDSNPEGPRGGVTPQSWSCSRPRGRRRGSSSSRTCTGSTRRRARC